MDHLKSLPSFSVPFYPLSKFWGKIGRLSWPMTRWRFQVHKPSHSGAKQMRCNQRSLWLCEDPVPHSKQREMSLSKCLAPSIALRLQEMTHLYIFQKERASLGGRSEFFFFLDQNLKKILPVLRPRAWFTMDSRAALKGWPWVFENNGLSSSVLLSALQAEGGNRFLAGESFGKGTQGLQALGAGIRRRAGADPGFGGPKACTLGVGWGTLCHNCCSGKQKMTVVIMKR